MYVKIGELARLTGVSTKTIRFYESAGVLPKPDRLANGYRSYALDSVDRLSFVKDAQAAGLSLDEIASVLDLRERGEATCGHVLGLLERHLADLDSRIDRLNDTKQTLQALMERARRLDPADCVDPNRCQTIAPGAAGERGAAPGFRRD